MRLDETDIYRPPPLHDSRWGLIKTELHFTITCGFIVQQAVQQNPQQIYN